MSSTRRPSTSLPPSIFRSRAKAESWMTLISSFWSLRSLASSIDSICLARSSFSTPFRLNTLAPMMVPVTPGGTRSELSRTSPAFSPKMARSSFSSGDSWVSPLGVIFPTRTSPGFTSAPMRMMPDSSRSLRASSPTLGMSRVISSLPSLVSRAMHSNSSMWIEVKMSSLSSRSLRRIESSKL